jgi:hypothetical protein
MHSAAYSGVGGLGPTCARSGRGHFAQKLTIRLLPTARDGNAVALWPANWPIDAGMAAGALIDLMEVTALFSVVELGLVRAVLRVPVDK